MHTHYTGEEKHAPDYWPEFPDRQARQQGITLIVPIYLSAVGVGA